MVLNGYVSDSWPRDMNVNAQIGSIFGRVAQISRTPAELMKCFSLKCHAYISYYHVLFFGFKTMGGVTNMFLVVGDTDSAYNTVSVCACVTF